MRLVRVGPQERGDIADLGIDVDEREPACVDRQELVGGVLGLAGVDQAVDRTEHGLAASRRVQPGRLEARRDLRLLRRVELQDPLVHRRSEEDPGPGGHAHEQVPGRAGEHLDLRDPDHAVAARRRAGRGDVQAQRQDQVANLTRSGGVLLAEALGDHAAAAPEQLAREPACPGERARDGVARRPDVPVLHRPRGVHHERALEVGMRAVDDLLGRARGGPRRRPGGGAGGGGRVGGGRWRRVAPAGERPARARRRTRARLGGRGDDRAGLAEIARDRRTGAPLGAVDGLGDRLEALGGSFTGGRGDPSTRLEQRARSIDSAPNLELLVTVELGQHLEESAQLLDIGRRAAEHGGTRGAHELHHRDGQQRAGELLLVAVERGLGAVEQHVDSVVGTEPGRESDGAIRAREPRRQQPVDRGAREFGIAAILRAERDRRCLAARLLVGHRSEPLERGLPPGAGLGRLLLSPALLVDLEPGRADLGTRRASSARAAPGWGRAVRAARAGPRQRCRTPAGAPAPSRASAVDPHAPGTPAGASPEPRHPPVAARLAQNRARWRRRARIPFADRTRSPPR